MSRITLHWSHSQRPIILQGSQIIGRIIPSSLQEVKRIKIIEIIDLITTLSFLNYQGFSSQHFSKLYMPEVRRFRIFLEH